MLLSLGVSVNMLVFMRADGIICSSGVSVFSAGILGPFPPHEGLIVLKPEVCSVVVLDSALNSQECTFPLNAAGLLQSDCRAGIPAAYTATQWLLGKRGQQVTLCV